MSDTLEAGYRSILRMLPRGYRAEHSDEMLAVLMDGAAPGQRRPKPREVLSLATFALRLRFMVGGPRESGRPVGDIARRAILAYLVFEFGLLMQLDGYGARIGYWFIPGLLHLGVIITLLRGWSWYGRALCIAYAGYIIHNTEWHWVFREPWWYAILSSRDVLVLVAATVAFHRGTPRMAGTSRWFSALVVLTVLFWIRGKTVDHMWGFDITHTPALSAFIYAATAIVALQQAKSSPVWPSALSLAGLPAVAGIVLPYLIGPGPFHALSDSPRDTFYVEVVIGAEFVMMATALAAFLLHQRRTVPDRRNVA
ncbi:hypothetical protein ABIA35_000939 [Catenulispora sp. MAP12-49]|uniref:hypothetical protein n=1 Tax=Catenulispora sp. MAP12-49 TaxID=3156302 RepID=UPI003517C287